MVYSLFQMCEDTGYLSNCLLVLTRRHFQRSSRVQISKLLAFFLMCFHGVFWLEVFWTIIIKHLPFPLSTSPSSGIVSTKRIGTAILGYQDGSVSKCPCCHAWWPEFCPGDSQSGRTICSFSFSLSPLHTLRYIQIHQCMCTYMHSHILNLRLIPRLLQLLFIISHYTTYHPHCAVIQSII